MPRPSRGAPVGPRSAPRSHPGTQPRCSRGRVGRRRLPGEVTVGDRQAAVAAHREDEPARGARPGLAATSAVVTRSDVSPVVLPAAGSSEWWSKWALSEPTGRRAQRRVEARRAAAVPVPRARDQRLAARDARRQRAVDRGGAVGHEVVARDTSAVDDVEPAGCAGEVVARAPPRSRDGFSTSRPSATSGRNRAESRQAIGFHDPYASSVSIIRAASAAESGDGPTGFPAEVVLLGLRPRSRPRSSWPCRRRHGPSGSARRNRRRTTDVRFFQGFAPVTPGQQSVDQTVDGLHHAVGCGRVARLGVERAVRGCARRSRRRRSITAPATSGAAATASSLARMAS